MSNHPLTNEAIRKEKIRKSLPDVKWQAEQNRLYIQLETAKTPQLTLKYLPILTEVSKTELLKTPSKADLIEEILNIIKETPQPEHKNLMLASNQPSIILETLLKILPEKTPSEQETIVQQTLHITGVQVITATTTTLLEQHYPPTKLLEMLHYITNQTELNIDLVDTILTNINTIKEIPVEWWLPLYTEKHHEQ